MKRFVIGVTGGFGTGKSTVARMLGRYGAEVLDADRIARDAVSPGGGIYKKIVSLFGSSILDKDKRIDRKKLGRVVFDDREKLMRLNALVHPHVIRRIKDAVRRGKKRFCVIDAPLLIEAGLHKQSDVIVVVTASPRTQIARAAKNLGITKKDAVKRIGRQLPLKKKMRLADFIIDNDGSLRSTGRRVERLWRKITKGDKVWRRKG